MSANRALPAILTALLAAAAPARAADLPSLPTQAVDPTLTASGWKGWSFGGAVVGGFGKGARGQFGGDTFLGYNHTFANDVNLSVRFATGYAPAFANWAGAKGFDFAAVSAKTTFNVSSPVRPFFYSSGTVARNAGFGGPSLNPLATLNGALGPGAGKGLGSVGAGVTIDLTPNSVLELGARIGAPGPLDP